MDLKREQRQLEALVRRLPRVAGNMAVNHFKESFEKGGFTDKTFTRWKPRKARRGKRRKTDTRNVLVKTGNLRRSIRVLGVSSQGVKVGTDEVYAEVHNEGLNAGRQPQFKMEQRQFIGQSQQLERQLENMVRRELNRIL